MSRVVPKYRRHPNGSAFVSHKSIPNKSHRLYLGKYDSPESRTKYQEFLALLASGGDPTPRVPIGSRPSVNALIVAYLTHAEDFYRREDQDSSEYDQMIYAVGPLAMLFGSQPAALFGPQKLTQIRLHLLSKGLARTYINSTISRINKFWRWACENEYVPADIYFKLRSVRGLSMGQYGVKEMPKVRPAAEESLWGIMPFVSEKIGQMMRIQYYCGMRPGEVCKMRAADIDTSGPIWLYRPRRHKTARFGIDLVKAIPSIVQPVLRPLLSQPSFLFPIDNEHRAAFRKRTTPVYASELKRREKEKSRRRAKRLAMPIRYSTSAYGRAVARGFDRAEEAGLSLERFSPNQLRHAIGTRVRRLLGKDAAQLWLWHQKADTTEIYAEKQVGQLIEIAQALDTLWKTSA